MTILERFLKYISINTTSNPKKEDNPSTKEQLNLANALIAELIELNIDEINFDPKHCYVYAKLKGNQDLPKIGFVAHLDTSPDAKGENINPKITYNYDGKDIMLNESTVLSPKDYPDLKNHIGKTIITTDGTTLLGSDDKAGIAEIMQMLTHFATTKDNHGDIFVCFTPDEEIGLGTKNLNYNIFKPDFAYTVDGSTIGELSYENFNAATIDITIKGNNIHTGYAKDKMINAGRIATIINSLLPDEIPENTEGYQGFYYLQKIEGNSSFATMQYLIRDFDITNFEYRKQILESIVSELNDRYKDSIKVNIKDTYYNMKKTIDKHPELIETTIKAMKDVNVTPIITPIRGGTDGANISESGIACPNIGTGAHNFHSIYEYVCLEDMEKTTEVLVSIVNKFSKNKVLQK